MGKAMPEGWCVDAEGHPTTDPQRMKDGGALLTIGKDRALGQHKGYCLSAMVCRAHDILDALKHMNSIGIVSLCEFHLPFEA